MFINIILKPEGFLFFKLSWSFSGQTEMSQLLLSCSVFFPGVIFTSDKSSSENSGLGLPWSSVWDCMLPMQEAQVQSLVGELRSHTPRCVAKKKKRTKERKSKFIFNSSNSFSSQQQEFQRQNMRNSVSRNSGCLFLLSVSYHRGLVPPQCLGLQVLKFCLWWYHHKAWQNAPPILQ